MRKRNVMATLITGEKVPLLSVEAILINLDTLATQYGGFHAYELREMCRNPAYSPFGRIGKQLQECSLLADWNPFTRCGTVHPDTRAVVLAAVQGEGANDLTVSSRIVVSTEEVDVR
jgi:hypothetical protein